MSDQYKRAVEGLARCGISLEGLCDAFPKFPAKEVREIYWKVHEFYSLPILSVKDEISCT